MNKENKNVTNTDIPLGLGMAFAQNVGAMQYFTSLSAAERQSVVDRAKSVGSRAEMQAFVADLGHKG